MIPKQLKNPEFRFCRIHGPWNKLVNLETKEVKLLEEGEYSKDKFEGWITEGKRPKGNNWQANGFTADEIKTEELYGVIAGFGRLRILDIDNKDLVEEFDKKLDTFSVETGGGGRHYYIFSDHNTNHASKTFGEFRANNQMVIGPGCRHPTGKYYTIKNNADIKEVSEEEIIELLKSHIAVVSIPTSDLETEIGKPSDLSRSGVEFGVVCNLIKKFGVDDPELKKKVFDYMSVYGKWSSAVQQYKEHTFKKSLEAVKKELETKIPEFTAKQKAYNAQFIETKKEEIKILERDTINASDLFQHELKPVEYHINKLIPKGSLILIGGNSGEFKTGLTLNLILSMIQGSSFLEIFPAIDNPKILYYEIDGNGKRSIQWKLKYFINGNNYNTEVLKQIDFEYLFYQDLLKTELENIDKYDIIILDSYRRFLKGSENDSKVTNDFFLNFLKIAKAKKKTVIVLHHLKKPSDEQQLIHAFRGNTDIVSQFDVVYGVIKTPDEQDVKNRTNSFEVAVECAKDRDDAVIKNFKFKVSKDEKIVKTTLTFLGYGSSQSKRSKQVILILSYLKDHKIKGRQDILKFVLEKFKCSIATIDGALKELTETGEIEKDSYGTYKLKEEDDPQNRLEI